MNLDYSLESEKERMEYVKSWLDTCESTPNADTLTKLADYVMYGKDENGDRRPEARTNGRRHPETYGRMESKVASLDGILETAGANEMTFNSAFRKSPYTKPTLNIKRISKRADGSVDPGDSDVPNMVELWASIDKLQTALDRLTSGQQYEAYKLQHTLINLRREQYVLRDAAKPPIKFVQGNHGATATSHINFSEDSSYWMTEDEWRRKLAASYNPRLSRNIDDYETKVTPQGVMVKWVVRRQKFDWENPRHVRALIEHYDQLEVQDGNEVESWGYALLKDLQTYRKMANFSPLRNFLLEMRLRAHSYKEISAAVEKKFGVKYNDSYLCGLLTNEIPKKIANTATKHKILQTTPLSEYKECVKCGRRFPAHAYFFGFNATEPDKLTKACCECIKGGNIAKYDKRKKDQTMYQVQTGAKD